MRGVPPPDFPQSNLRSQYTALGRLLPTRPELGSLVGEFVQDCRAAPSASQTPAPDSQGAAKVAAASRANQAGGGGKSPGKGKGGPDYDTYSVTVMVRWRVNPRDSPEAIYPLSPGRLGMVLKKAFGDFRVSYIKDEGQLCHTEEGGWALVGVRPEAASALEGGGRDADKQFTYEWAKANKQPYSGGMLRAHHMEKSNAVLQRIRSGDLMAGPNGVIRARDRDGAGEEGRKRRRSPSWSPPRASHRSEGDYTPRQGKQISLAGGRISPGRLTTCFRVYGRPVGWALRLPSAGAGQATSPATTMAPSGRRLGAGPPVLRPPRRRWGTVPLPSGGDAPSGPAASSPRDLPPTHRLLGSAAYGTPLPGGRPGAPLRGDHAPAGDEHPTGPVPTPAVRATSPERGRGGNSLGVRGALVRGTSPSGRNRGPARPREPGGAPRLGAQSVRGARDEPPLPAPITLGWDAGDVFSPGAVAHGQLKLLALDSICPGRPYAQWGIVFGVSGAMCGVRDVAATPECLPGLHPTLGHVSLFQGDWRLPAILQQWAAHMAVYQIAGGHLVQVYSGGGGVTHPPGAEGSVTWVPRSTYSRGRVVFKAASGSSTAYVAANVDARALGRYLRRSTALELPAKDRQAILGGLEHAVGPAGLGTLGGPAGDTAYGHHGPGGLRAITLNLRRGLGVRCRLWGLVYAVGATRTWWDCRRWESYPPSSWSTPCARPHSPRQRIRGPGWGCWCGGTPPFGKHGGTCSPVGVA